MRLCLFCVLSLDCHSCVIHLSDLIYIDDPSLRVAHNDKVIYYYSNISCYRTSSVILLTSLLALISIIGRGRVDNRLILNYLHSHIYITKCLAATPHFSLARCVSVSELCMVFILQCMRNLTRYSLTHTSSTKLRASLHHLSEIIYNLALSLFAHVPGTEMRLSAVAQSYI